MDIVIIVLAPCTRHNVIVVCCSSPVMLLLFAVPALCTMYVRYKLVQELNHGNDTSITRMSRACMVLALFSSFGLTVVGNFQVGVKYIVVVVVY